MTRTLERSRGRTRAGSSRPAVLTPPFGPGELPATLLGELVVPEGTRPGIDGEPGELYLTAAGPTPEGRTLFTEGLCWLLALHLHVQSGFPIVMIASVPDSPLLEWCHVLVQTPTGELLDVEGPASLERTLDSWAPACHEPESVFAEMVELDSLGSLLVQHPHEMAPETHALASATARFLLDRLHPTS